VKAEYLCELNLHNQKDVREDVNFQELLDQRITERFNWFKCALYRKKRRLYDMRGKGGTMYKVKTEQKSDTSRG